MGEHDGRILRSSRVFGSCAGLSSSQVHLAYIKPEVGGGGGDKYKSRGFKLMLFPRQKLWLPCRTPTIANETHQSKGAPRPPPKQPPNLPALPPKAPPLRKTDAAPTMMNGRH